MSDTRYPIDFLWQILTNAFSDIQPERVMIWNNKSSIPNDDGLFLLIEFAGTKVIANSIQEQEDDDDEDVLNEVQTLTTQETYNIEIMSRDLSALRRKEEVIMALRSTYSQNIQTENGIMIAKIANLIDLSGLEASARLFRFQCAVTLHASYTKQNEIDYYNTFDVEVNTEDGEQKTISLPT